MINIHSFVDEFAKIASTPEERNDATARTLSSGTALAGGLTGYRLSKGMSTIPRVAATLAGLQLGGTAGNLIGEKYIRTKHD